MKEWKQMKWHQALMDRAKEGLQGAGADHLWTKSTDEGP